MDEMKHHKKNIEILKSTLINQLKNYSWDDEGSSASYYRFKNKYFQIEWNKNSTRKYTLKLLPSRDELNLIDIINIWHFRWLKYWYVNNSLKDYRNRKDIKRLSDQSNRFFENHKSLRRDSQLDKLLDE